jgi:starch-binding outer membrane protein SusE/F
MKNIFKSILTVALFTGLFSCEDESDLAYIQPAAASFQIITPSNGESVILSEDALNNPAISLTWDPAQYSTPSSVTYTIQLAPNGSDFSNAQDLSSTTNRNAVITTGQLNVPALTAGAVPFVSTALDFRIKATVAGQLPLYSNVITYNVTAFGCLGQYAVGAGIPSAGWNWNSPANLICDNNVLTMKVGLINDTFRFFTENGNWGSGRNFPYYANQGYKIVSVLEDALDGDNNFRFTGTPDTYRVKIDENNKTIGVAKSTVTSGIEPTSYWLVGAATPGGWSWTGNNETELPVVSNGIYEVPVNLINNESFRVWLANDGTDAWGLPNRNYPSFSGDGYTIDSELINALDGDSNFRYVGPTGVRLFKINTVTKVISVD